MIIPRQKCFAVPQAVLKKTVDPIAAVARKFRNTAKAKFLVAKPAVPKSTMIDRNIVINSAKVVNSGIKSTKGGLEGVITNPKVINNLPKRQRSELGFKGIQAKAGDRFTVGQAIKAGKNFSE